VNTTAADKHDSGKVTVVEPRFSKKRGRNLEDALNKTVRNLSTFEAELTFDNKKCHDHIVRN
jgi:hypothetical protein